tara:strand:+ start:2719 stop:2979 length:261 start_codon:yes stop_codon:yes gene_type:complete
MAYKNCDTYTDTVYEIKRRNEVNKKLAIEKLELQKRIAEFEDKEKHLSRVIYNTARIAFVAGACCPYMDFKKASIDYAEKFEGGVL